MTAVEVENAIEVESATADGAAIADPPADDAPARARRPLRDVLGRYATGVTVVTTRWQAGPAGLTVNSFTSLSLEPPLILWCLNRVSGSRAAFTAARHFAVNVLAADQYETALGFAGPGDRFAGRAYRTGAHGLPVLERTVGTLICRRERIVPAGDHLVVIGEVLEYSAGPGAALLFVDGAYHAGPASCVRGSPD